MNSPKPTLDPAWSALETRQRVAHRLADHLATSHDPRLHDLSRRIQECGRHVIGVAVTTPGHHGRHVRVTSANFCNSPACPACRYRIAMRRGYEFADRVRALRMAEPSVALVSITLTVPGYKSPAGIQANLTRLRKAFPRFIEGIGERCVGAVRVLETKVVPTDDPETPITVHPHIHAIVAFRRSDAAEQFSPEACLHLWSEAIGHKKPLPPEAVHVRDCADDAGAVDFYRYALKSPFKPGEQPPFPVVAFWAFGFPKGVHKVQSYGVFRGLKVERKPKLVVSAGEEVVATWLYGYPGYCIDEGGTRLPRNQIVEPARMCIKMSAAGVFRVPWTPGGLDLSAHFRRKTVAAKLL